MFGKSTIFGGDKVSDHNILWPLVGRRSIWFEAGTVVLRIGTEDEKKLFERTTARSERIGTSTGGTS
jgi:hypothetical protein